LEAPLVAADVFAPCIGSPSTADHRWLRKPFIPDYEKKPGTSLKAVFCMSDDIRATTQHHCRSFRTGIARDVVGKPRCLRRTPMTSHAVLINVRPGAILNGPDASLPDVPAASTNTVYVADGPESYGLGWGGEDFWMYLQLRATRGTFNKCLIHLDRQLQAHPGADVEVVGIGTDQHTVRVIIGVNLGDSSRIKTRPKNVVAAYEFVQSLSADLANFWPQYLTGTPTDDERDLLASVVAAGTIQTRPTMLVGPDARAAAEVLTSEPERQFALDGHSASWQVESAVA